MINCITVEGNWITDHSLIKDAFFQFYKVKSQAQDSQISFPNLPYSQTLNSMDRDYLERLATHEEIKEAVWDCGSSKAPGPDRFSFAFVKKYWDIIKKDLHDFINSFFASCDMPYGANSSFFTLIPKVNNPTLITDFHPISLIGIHYKIIAKILANWLSKVIDKIVSKEQSTFIDGRQILDGPIILSEIIEFSDLDLNGVLGSKHAFHLQEPLFLLMVALCLHNAFAHAVSNGLISGININNSSINISYLFFADDVIITTGWNARDLENIICVLHVFYLASRLKINIHKSNIYGIGVNEDEVYNMASKTGCIAGNIPFYYLSLPIGSNMKSIASWKMLIDRFRSRLSTWKASLLSIGGRLTLIKSVLGSLGIYYLSIFRAPESVLNDLERIRSTFIWELLTLLFSKNGAGGCSLLQMIYGLKSLKLFMVMKVVLIIMTAISRVGEAPLSIRANIVKAFHGLTSLDPQTSFTRKIGQLNIVASEDTCVWNLGPNGTFTVKDARNIIDQKTLPSLPSTSWEKIIPRKVNIFMWRLSLDRLPHRLNLSLRGMDIPAISCSSCNANVESADHIFFECIIASDLWKLMYRWCEIPFVQALSFEAFKDWLSSWHAPKEKKHMLFIISTSRQFDFILDGLAEVPSNDRVFRQWLNALFQKAAFLSRLLPRGLFGVSSKTISE
ncbi:RNA-directed DNA polymerase, eukaryota, reverse transcriptase zinc-binding domain protein [Tanacetum coccineum]|uniref:RNA-directed DNA polymerase, eukaryota, reverse transcriptase zinc-binding domain protein n=1 Tax=Tanacetum coccineum TaxID=301880 RepID=A0ABQ5IYC2_9ASTR